MYINQSELIKVQNEIVRVNRWLAEFWSNSHGWAPYTAAELMSKSRLDNQVALSHTLAIWLEQEEKPSKNGRLILAWANLGALIEGTLKLFLCAYYEDYCDDLHAYRDKREKLQDPDSLALERLRVFFDKRDLWSKEWNEYVLSIQNKRNAIHAFQDKEIGTFEEFYNCLPAYLLMIKRFNLGLPYPEEAYIPAISRELDPIMKKTEEFFDRQLYEDASSFWQDQDIN
ncbi:hypothetical protein [Methylovulum miyakonense]|uniref:hypothetical protein n=1 Tax=Methylovulum miyakonense TaxID=645578 RepID=UPI0003631E47|nr:hypothetical protein [Methylovulum miyakonense]